MTMLDKIGVLHGSSVAPVGSPLELYSRPSGLFVASFSGSPTMRLFRGAPADERGAATIGAGPEHTDDSAIPGEWLATARLAEHLGSDTFVHADADGVGALNSRSKDEAPLKPDQRIFVTPREANLHRFDTEGRRIN